MKLLQALFFFIFLFSVGHSIVWAESYTEFYQRVKSDSELARKDGISYLISGGIALIGGGYGWAHSKKSVEKGFYSLAQSLGLLAIGYGAESYFLKHDDEIFLQVLSSTELTRMQKDRMVESYIKEKKEREKDILMIRRTTFGLAGLLNIIYAAKTKDQTLQNFLYMTAGVQLVWAFTF